MRSTAPRHGLDEFYNAQTDEFDHAMTHTEHVRSRRGRPSCHNHGMIHPEHVLGTRSTTPKTGSGFVQRRPDTSWINLTSAQIHRGGALDEFDYAKTHPEHVLDAFDHVQTRPKQILDAFDPAKIRSGLVLQCPG